MLSELINLKATPNRCIIAVNNLILLAEMRRNLQTIDIENERSGRPKWDYTLVVDTDEALEANKEGVLYIITELGNPSIDVTAMVKHFQVPLFLISSDPILSQGSKSSFDTLANETVYGYVQNPGCQEIFSAMIQMHRMAVSVKALSFGSMLMVGIEQGK